MEPLIEALGDEDAQVRAYVAGALGQIGDVRAVEPLGKVETNDEATSVVSAAKEALRLIQANSEESRVDEA